ncbi:MAG: RHS repeat-associated core domain-containing protein, partial [Fimbriimonas ginsengisoli]|nr:RHS repeat-associated core domain-containing protein [Fimbriimonas ginsengisoli]
YDYEDRITSITYPSTATNTFTYNGLDTRVGKVDSAGTKTYKRDGAGVTDAVLSDGAANYTPGVSERRSGASKFYHSDRMGTDSRLTDSSQATTDTKTYDAFGTLVASTGSTPTPFGYAGNFGYQEDADSGLKLLGHRYYDPSTGRFLTRDPAKNGRNWYGYVQNNPLRFLDPAGLGAGALIGGLAGGAYGAEVGTLILPGPGTVVGACLGAAIGTLFGALYGDNETPQQATTDAVIAGASTLIAPGVSKLFGFVGTRTAENAAIQAWSNSPGQILARNRIQHEFGVVQVREEFEAAGYTVTVPKEYIPTRFGRRMPDLIVESGTDLWHVEVKTGGATYGGMQRIKDLALLMDKQIRTDVVHK